jgi:hypothetical protein
MDESTHPRADIPHAPLGAVPFTGHAGWQEIGYIDKAASPFDHSLRHGTIVIGPDTFNDRSAYEGTTIEAVFTDINPDVIRWLFGIPPGFPLWYVPERLALPVGPIGRLIQRTQCVCGHDSLQHIVVLRECLGDYMGAHCQCRDLVMAYPQARPSWWVRPGRWVCGVLG